MGRCEGEGEERELELLAGLEPRSTDPSLFTPLTALPCVSPSSPSFTSLALLFLLRSLPLVMEEELSSASLEAVSSFFCRSSLMMRVTLRSVPGLTEVTTERPALAFPAADLVVVVDVLLPALGVMELLPAPCNAGKDLALFAAGGVSVDLAG